MKRRQMYLMTGTLLLGSFITTLAETLMNNGLPLIMRETNASQMDAQWLSTGYMLVAGMVMPLATFFINRFSLRKLFTATMSTFLVGSIVAAVAPSFALILTGRLIQATAVGVIMPLVTNVITIIIPPRQRGLAIGIAGIVINLGPAIGPTLSGVILEFYDWRMLFIILIPISILIIICTQMWVQNVITPRPIQLDLPSAFTSIMGLGFLIYGLCRCGSSSSNPVITGLFLLLGLIFLGLFIHRELTCQYPLLDLHVFKFGRYRLGLIITLLISAAIMAPELTLPLFNQDVLRVTPIISGMVMIPSASAMAILSPLSGRLYDELGARNLTIWGSLVGLLMALPMIFYNQTTGIILITIFYAFRCAGLILCYTPASVYALNALPQKQVISGNTIITALVQVANSFATALAVTTKNVSRHWFLLHGFKQTLAIVKGYQAAFGSTVVVTMIALILAFKLSQSKN